jgi:CRP-like cAMP-binding protein
MYIILKGRVSVESNLSQYEDIPVILNTLKDGDAFGELAVIDSNKILEDTTRTGD